MLNMPNKRISYNEQPRNIWYTAGVEAPKSTSDMAAHLDTRKSDTTDPRDSFADVLSNEDGRQGLEW
jgi:hypothetical protein